jgi:hypothetical protein
MGFLFGHQAVVIANIMQERIKKIIARNAAGQRN